MSDWNTAEDLGQMWRVVFQLALQLLGFHDNQILPLHASFMSVKSIITPRKIWDKILRKNLESTGHDTQGSYNHDVCQNTFPSADPCKHGTCLSKWWWLWCKPETVSQVTKLRGQEILRPMYGRHVREMTDFEILRKSCGVWSANIHIKKWSVFWPLAKQKPTSVTDTGISYCLLFIAFLFLEIVSWCFIIWRKSWLPFHFLFFHSLIYFLKEFYPHKLLKHWSTWNIDLKPSIKIHANMERWRQK